MLFVVAIELNTEAMVVIYVDFVEKNNLGKKQIPCWNLKKNPLRPDWGHRGQKTRGAGPSVLAIYRWRKLAAKALYSLLPNHIEIVPLNSLNNRTSGVAARVSFMAPGVILQTDFVLCYTCFATNIILGKSLLSHLDMLLDIRDPCFKNLTPAFQVIFTGVPTFPFLSQKK